MFESGDTFCGRQFRCGKFFSCEKAGQNLDMARGSYPPRKLSNISKRDNRSLQFYYFAWLYGNKGVIVGRAIGEFLTGKEIPPAFKTVIEAAVSYSKGEIL